MNWNEMKWIEKYEMKHAVLVMKLIENIKWNELKWIEKHEMKHAVAVMKWIEKHEIKYELKWNVMKWNELKWIKKREWTQAVLQQFCPWEQPRTYYTEGFS